jgi:hypothetical protein
MQDNQLVEMLLKQERLIAEYDRFVDWVFFSLKERKARDTRRFDLDDTLAHGAAQELRKILEELELIV